MYATVRRYEGVTEPSVMISTSVFQDQSGAEESNKRAADYVRENLASLLPKPPQITAGEVVAHKAK